MTCEHDPMGHGDDIHCRECGVSLIPLEPGSVAELGLDLIRAMHDAMDELNNTAKISLPDGFDAILKPGLRAMCIWCKDFGYDANGIRHKDNCLLIRARRLLSPPSPHSTAPPPATT